MLPAVTSGASEGLDVHEQILRLERSAGHREHTCVCKLEQGVEKGNAHKADCNQSQVQEGQPPEGCKEGFQVASILIEFLNTDRFVIYGHPVETLASLRHFWSGRYIWAAGQSTYAQSDICSSVEWSQQHLCRPPCKIGCGSPSKEEDQAVETEADGVPKGIKGPVLHHPAIRGMSNLD